MSLNGCLNIAVNAGQMTRERADELIRTAEAFATEEAEAAQRMIDTAFTESALTRKQAALDALAKTRAIANQAAHPLGKSTGLMSLMVRDITGLATNENIDQMGQAIMTGYWRKLSPVIEAMRTKVLGLTQDTKVARETISAIIDGKAGDPLIARLANVVAEVFEDLRNEFNKAGGHILKRKGWFPTAHNAKNVGKAAEILGSDQNSDRAWVDYIKTRIRLDYITDDLGRPLTGQALDEVLLDTYQSIATDGVAQIKALQHGQLKMANRHRESRFLVFKDSAAWLEYNKLFGHDDVFVAITDYVQNMSNEISMMKMFGPNPDHTFKALREIAKGDAKLRDQGGLRDEALEAVWNAVSGKINQIQAPRLANFMQGFRNTLTSIRLGSAMLSATADTMITRNVAAWNGLSFTRIMGRYFELMNPLNAADRKAAAAMHGIVEGYITRSLGGNRFGEVTGLGKTAIIADMTMKATLLTPHTQWLQTAVAEESLHALASRAAMSFDEINEIMPVRRFFSPEEWDVLRANAVDRFDVSGQQVEFMTVEKINAANLSDEAKRTLSRKLITYARDHADRAVPVPDARSRAFMTGGEKRGSIKGEGARAVMQFKGFPLSVLLQNLFYRQHQAVPGGRVSYMASLMVGTTLMGAFALQLKEIANGRDPLPMADENAAKFWLRAWAQGGGAGIFGDFVIAGARGKNRYGQSIWTTMLGPTAGTVDEFLDLTAGNLMMAAGAKEGEINLGADVAKVLKDYTPFLSSAWYAKLAFQRAIVDQLALELDPKASEKMRRNERRIMREQNQKYWWEPGELTPDRAPEIL